jgi:hypothetical protein
MSDIPQDDEISEEERDRMRKLIKSFMDEEKEIERARMSATNAMEISFDKLKQIIEKYESWSQEAQETLALQAAHMLNTEIENDLFDEYDLDNGQEVIESNLRIANLYNGLNGYMEKILQGSLPSIFKQAATDAQIQDAIKALNSTQREISGKFEDATAREIELLAENTILAATESKIKENKEQTLAMLKRVQHYINTFEPPQLH